MTSSMLSGLLLTLLLGANAFQSPPTRPLSTQIALSPSLPARHLGKLTSSSVAGPLYLWGNKNKDDDGETTESNGEEEAKKAEEKSGRMPFFAGLRRSGKKEENEAEIEKEGSVATADPTPAPAPRRPQPIAKEDPMSKAQSLRAQAERARLEAEKMDAELTLRKIARLEKDMAVAVAKDETDNIEKIQREMDALQAKMRGEAPKPSSEPKREEQKLEDDTTSSTKNQEGSSTSDSLKGDLQDVMAVTGMDTKDVEKISQNLKMAPGFMKKIVAQVLEVDFDSADDINCTELAVRINQVKRADFSFSKRPEPTFSRTQIEEAKRKVKDDPSFSNIDLFDKDVLENAQGNDTKLALLTLESDYYFDAYGESEFKKLVEGEDWLKEVIDVFNKTEIDSIIETIYPGCTRKVNASLPTEAQVQMLMSDVLPKASFTPRGMPQKVLGGYIVRGSSRFKKGDEILNAIEQELENTNLKDKMTVLLTKDFALFEDDKLFNPDDEPPILFIMGPDIVPERRRIQLSLTSALGIASCWYLAIYPFLLNPALMKRTEEQLALADANMGYDLSWLSGLSLPLFFTFIGIQAVHEAGHRLAASLNEVELTLPTFVPSPITGITSSVTQFKTLPKNKEALFDISFAGPIAGVAASLAALVVGSQLTLSSDASLLPALPLEILRQSTLGGGIIDTILGAGALSVPEGTAGTQAVAGMTVSLHPIAVAGYIGLIVNALALLPIGTTDGGRIALAAYGRGSKLVVSNIMLLAAFLVGLLGSDLFLFYFAFLIAFQTGNEVPARNEVDNISFPRVCLAIGSTVVALLALIPFQ